jgi:hypothetical protein
MASPLRWAAAAGQVIGHKGRITAAAGAVGGEAERRWARPGSALCRRWRYYGCVSSSGRHPLSLVEIGSRNPRGLARGSSPGSERREHEGEPRHVSH